MQKYYCPSCKCTMGRFSVSVKNVTMGERTKTYARCKLCGSEVAWTENILLECIKDKMKTLEK